MSTTSRAAGVFGMGLVLVVGAAALPAQPASGVRHTSRRLLHGVRSAGLQCTGAQPPLVTDLEVRQAPALAEPAACTPLRDPVFGSCPLRVSDHTRDLAPGDGSGGLKNEYSRVQAFNADGTRLVPRSPRLGRSDSGLAPRH